jgi:hypothetical protein
MDVFISSSANDRAFAEALSQRLQADGITIWTDTRDTVSIERGLDSVRHIICLISPSWDSTAWFTLERYSVMVDDLDGFLGKLVPVVLSKGTTIPRFMKPLPYFDCSDPGSLDRVYPAIRDRIRCTRLAERRETPAPVLPALPASGDLPRIGYVFVVGNPGAGKSTFCRFMMESLAEHHVPAVKRSDYPYLQAMFRLDLARGNRARFGVDPKSEFTVRDLAVYDEALKLVHDQILAPPATPNTLTVIEFSRPYYDHAFLYYTLRALVNSAIVHVDTPLAICRARNETRRLELERRLAAVEHTGGAFDFDADIHYVPTSVYERYQREAQETVDQSLVFALMPARGYFRVDNSDDNFSRIRAVSRRTVAQDIMPLVRSSEQVNDFYRRRIAALEAFLARTQTS